MARPFSTLPETVKSLNEALLRGLGIAVKTAATAADETVVRLTRVDTGLHRSNWLVSRNAPLTNVIPPYAPGRKLGIEETANAQAALAQGKAAIGAFDIARDRSIHITNNAPAIGILNDGNARVPPANFGAMGAQSAVRAIKGIKPIAAGSRGRR